MRHYLDHASTTPLRPAARAAMARCLEEMASPGGAGDPGRVHQEGRQVRQAIEEAREQVAALAGVPPRRVVFTAGGTEAANTAISSALSAGRAGALCARVEHSAVRLACERHGSLLELPVDGAGTVDLAVLDRLLAGGEEIGLVNCQAANHEIGTVQPVEEVAELCTRAGVPLHVDAAASFGHLEEAVPPGADYTSLSAHKMGGPPGVGALVLGPRTRLRPLLLGGAEERGRRAGAEDLLGIVGFGAAAEEAAAALSEEAARTAALTAELVARAVAVEGVELLGPAQADRRLPHIACLSVAGVFGEAVLLGLDRAGVAVHSGSACSSESLEPSPVLEAIGAEPASSVRASLGWSSTAEDVMAFAASFEAVVSELRALGRAGSR